MLNKYYNISAIILLLAFLSCQKEETFYDREQVLSKDTVTHVFKVSYLSHNSQDLNVQLELITFNNNVSEKVFLGKSYSPHDFSAEFDISFSNLSEQTYAPESNYVNLMILDLSSKNIYDSHEAGIYLRRYFEIADSLPNRSLALSSLDPKINHPTRFYSQYPGSIFENSWEFNTKTMYELIGEQTQTSSAMPMLFFKNRIIESIDSLVAETGVTSQKSITLITSQGGFAGENQADFDEIISKANSNNVKINLITEYEDVSFQRIAIETGGFCSGLVPDVYGSYEENIDSIADPVQSALLNLDDLLLSNVTVHRVDMKVSKQTPEVWLSGERKRIYYIYDQKRRSVELKIP